MQAFQLCAFADEADSAIGGQIKALTENGIPYIELRGLETGSAIALSDRGARELKNNWTMRVLQSGPWALQSGKSA